MGKPVDVFSWPMRRGLALRLKEWLWACCAPVGGTAGDEPSRSIAFTGAALERLVDVGLVKPPRDFAALHRALRERGLIDGGAHAAPRRPLDDMERAVAAIRGLFAAGR
jgi:hypothetical protein